MGKYIANQLWNICINTSCFSNNTIPTFTFSRNYLLTRFPSTFINAVKFCGHLLDYDRFVFLGVIFYFEINYAESKLNRSFKPIK